MIQIFVLKLSHDLCCNLYNLLTLSFHPNCCTNLIYSLIIIKFIECKYFQITLINLCYPLIVNYLSLSNPIIIHLLGLFSFFSNSFVAQTTKLWDQILVLSGFLDNVQQI